jgi:hypothetical protein
MNIKRPCECGCSYDDHERVHLDSLKGTMETLYCKNCDKHDTWCYNYRPIKNLPWLEWLVR